MKITLSFTDEHARRLEGLLQRKYHSKASLAKLARIAICTESANQAKVDLEALGLEVTK